MCPQSAAPPSGNEKGGKESAATTQSAMWDALGNEVVDLLVVGGGITGAGVARDAARRGLKVAMVEMDDLASGTSSRSSKLVHGGLRYLEHYEFSLVFEAVSERRILMDLAPHLVNPLGFVFPVYAGSKHKLWFINAGMWLYDGLSLFRSPKVHKKMSPKETAAEVPNLNVEDLKGAPLYYDCSTDDARLTLETAVSAANEGAVVATYCRVESFLKNDEGRLRGAVVKNVLTGELKEVESHAIVNATGPWTDKTMSLSGPLDGGGVLRPTKGVHIVVDAEKLPVRHAIVLSHPEDERVLFALPWGDRTYVGTTDTDFEGDPKEVAATRDDVEYLVNASNHYFPTTQISSDDVIATWAGLRPLVAPPQEQGSVNESAVSREHQILVGHDGLITIAGGKLTTYRRMAGEAVDTAVRLLQLSGKVEPKKIKDAKTDENPLPGGIGWPSDDDHDRVATEVVASSSGVLTQEQARALTDAYGMRAHEIAKMCGADKSLAAPLVEGRPEILAQVDFAVREEFAVTVTDFLVRRTQLFYRDVQQGLGCAEKVAQRMATLLDWDAETTDARRMAYEAEVALSRQWQGQELTKVPNDSETETQKPVKA